MIYSTKNFHVQTDPKMVCTCCGEGGLSISILLVLETIRKHFGVPVTILSGARCVQYNKKVGGASKSIHKINAYKTLSDAADIYVKGVPPKKVAKFIETLPYSDLLGIGIYKTFIHVDTRGEHARWVSM
jgi:uncharacterized protein YcbK (DUF882 family)